MRIAPIPEGETLRLRALQLMQVLDTPGDARMDNITRLARKLFNVQTSLVSLVDQNRQWFYSRQGLDATETPRAVSFCGHAILQGELFVIEDARSDLRFRDNPLVTSGPKIRFYAGCPLTAASGHRVGTLCVIDPEPRSFSDEDRELLRDLGQLAQQQLRSIALASTDELTQISNRRGFCSLAKQGLSTAVRMGTGSTVLLIDLDDFKLINDRHGHEMGDQALQEFAGCMLRSCRDSDSIGRLGGDEFCVFMPGTGQDGAGALVKRLEAEVAALNASKKMPCTLQFSIGMTTADPTLDHDLDSLLALADSHMFADKRRSQMHRQLVNG